MFEKIKVKLHREDSTDDFNYMESIKTLRTNLQFSGNKLQVIMFTSSLPEEGKSDVSFTLAESLAQIGKKTLFIDADIRKSVIMTRYQISKRTKGLSQYLSGQTDLEHILCETNIENYDVIFAGQYSPNSADLLEDELFKNLIADLRKEYDYIIIDTPPVAAVTDASIVAGVCDGIVLVVESGTMSYRLVQQVKDQLDKTGVRILGVVLNKVDVFSEAYYNKYGKYRKYGKYGRYSRYGYRRYGYYKYSKYGKYGRYGKYGKYSKYGYNSDYAKYAYDAYSYGQYGPDEKKEKKDKK